MLTCDERLTVINSNLVLDLPSGSEAQIAIDNEAPSQRWVLEKIPN
jgi:hypothetical protein